MVEVEVWRVVEDSGRGWREKRQLLYMMWWIVVLGVTNWPIYSAYSNSIFFSHQDANRVLKVHKRANSFLEEMKPGSLERECIEERCDLEEANEIFETKEDTLNFWSKYFDGDQCNPNECVNAVCKDGIGKFDCICNEGWEGKFCAYEIAYNNCSLNNGGCMHFCRDSVDDKPRSCSCAAGYQLQDDYRSCKPFVNFPCGQHKIIDYDYSARLTGAKKGRKGDSPWQALLIQSKRFFCGGVLIHPYWILSAAHCFKDSFRNAKYYVRLGEYDRRTLEDTEQQISVSKVITHPKYDRDTVDNDIALLRLSQPAVYNKYVLPICLPSQGLAQTNLTVEGTETIVTGWGSQDQTARNRTQILSYIQVPIVSQENCSKVMNLKVTNNMLCAGMLGDYQDACYGDSGGPMVTRFGDTWFLVGLVSWGEECGRLDNFGVYTKVHLYHNWIDQEIEKYETETQKINQSGMPEQLLYIKVQVQSPMDSATQGQLQSLKTDGTLSNKELVIYKDAYPKALKSTVSVKNHCDEDPIQFSMQNKMSRIIYVTLFLLTTSSCYKVFIQKDKAHHVLRKRANHFLEEILPGNLERECYEETCSREEAREIFKSLEKTAEFWYHYKDLSPCKENPCLNKGICQQYHYTYTCLCPPRFAGRHCENVRHECWYNNGGCWQYCTDTPRSLSVICSCAQGYTLEEDGKRCEKAAQFPCGLPISSSRSLLDELDLEKDSEANFTVSTSSQPSSQPSSTTLPPPSGFNLSIALFQSNETTLTQATAKPPLDMSAQQPTGMWNDSKTDELTGNHSSHTGSAANISYIKNTNRDHEDFENLLEDEKARIVGGALCELGQCPWQVLIRTNRGVDFCGGTLISQRWVVSAAHCFEDVVPHHVTIGDYDKHLRDRDEQKIAVVQVFSHPYYIAEHYDHDIALLYLRSPAIFSEYSRPVCLPNPGLGRLLTQEGMIGQVSGWGATRHQGRFSRFLLKVHLPVISQETCMASTRNVLTGNMFCAGYNVEAKDACKGDSGGPFVVLYRSTWYLVGVVSWGEGCALEGKYGVYTRVSNYISWIKDTIIDTEGYDEPVSNTL
ncbi:uncharacterized protein PAF06_007496 [Gastrophryne carolinensis]